MTVMAEHASSQMSVDTFELIAEYAAQVDETVRLEFIGGRIEVKKVTDGNHGEIAMWLAFRCKQARPELTLNTTAQGLKVEAYRKGRVRPDALLAPVGHFSGQGDWAEPAGVLMAVEITSYDSDTHSRDRVEKPKAYAEAGIPVYLLIDRDNFSVVVHCDPVPEGKYRDVHAVAIGSKVSLPAPVNIDLDTEELRKYVD
ncbi:Uma2 family endonuclease [Streptomyces sp. RY43-2]|uniref:Uma2 family endonuclease n=1 Tax=Streptomyces macrolidinus TaxID=2952607 RepID=A0ABT0ZE12_9ACTN|nr:Uma2 family endonuclease [Streptomyces macrolidinus]MCN9241832.1 Uma2 family endonuclease [Streptomyces macrolidinus]